jgi:hypothetical protein
MLFPKESALTYSKQA